MLCKTWRRTIFARRSLFPTFHTTISSSWKKLWRNCLPGFPTWDRDHYPDSRKDFTNTGGTFNEGAAVRYTGYVFEAHAADTSGGESVNCDQSGAAPNDVHIALVPDSKATA